MQKFVICFSFWYGKKTQRLHIGSELGNGTHGCPMTRSKKLKITDIFKMSIFVLKNMPLGF